MNIQAKVALDKEKYPERYCKTSRCLWRVVFYDPTTRELIPAKDCKDGYCPRHKKGE
jgi:hypothetical protein